MLSNMDRRLSLGEQSYARHLLWEEPASSEHTASLPAMPDHQISKRKRLAVEMYETETVSYTHLTLPTIYSV